MSIRRSTKRTPKRISRAQLSWLGLGAGLLAVAVVVIAGYVTGTGDDGGRQSNNASLQLASWSGGDTLPIGEPEKPTVMLAIAGWCATCIEPARDLIGIHEAFGQRVDVVSYSVDRGETEETLQRFRETAGNGDYLWAFDREGVTLNTYGVASLDTVTIVDETGEKVFQAVRPSSERITRVLNELLADSVEQAS